ncbi:MAG: bifunctional tRNA (5-methylaminomethyl-2-thiouridine)(34)-methyltransferase MnmD/FAD-dependent 5-carboxymethylaminomethyl-2-thiouridine(34) oxidoreductase MnmC [Pseudomonadota bacterium]
MSELRTAIVPARVRWLDNGAPYNLDFDDIYFSPSKGVAESVYVYMEGNRLLTRWQNNQRANTPSNFAIGELGFGSGLNFLLTAQSWREHCSGSRLDYFGIEKHPLAKQDLHRALQLFPLLQEDSETLLEQYPPLLTGFHRLEFEGGISLNLLFGEASDSLASLRYSDRPTLCTQGRAIDAWYLDGFAPSKNSSMWSEELCRLVASLSNPGTTFSTFTAAGHVRRTLQDQGFSVNKQAGFSTKREMLTGQFKGPQPALRYRRNRWFPAATWYATSRQTAYSQPQAAPNKIAIIGAGLAGCTTAAALAQRGIPTTVIDSHDEIANGASGNPGAAFYSPLSAFSSPLSDFSLQAYLFACHYYTAQLGKNACGLLQCVDDSNQAAELASYVNDQDYVELLDPSACRKKANLILGPDKAALFFPHGRAIHIGKLCEQLIRNPRIHVQLGVRVSSLKYTNHVWQLRSDDQGQDFAEFDTVIICCGALSRQFSQLNHLPTRVIRGQVSLLPQTPQSANLRMVVCDKSYLIPAKEDQHWAGSSYVLDDWSEQIRMGEHLSNAAAAAALIGDASFNECEASAGWAALRCTSPDYLPIVGMAPMQPEFLKVFTDLQHDKNKPLEVQAPYHEGLFVNTAYGSRGLSFAPLCAQQLASQICGELSPLPSTLRQALSPARFIVRNITRGHFAAR